MGVQIAPLSGAGRVSLLQGAGDPVLTYTGLEPGSTVRTYRNGTLAGADIADASGKASRAFPSGLTTGDTITFEAVVSAVAAVVAPPPLQIAIPQPGGGNSYGFPDGAVGDPYSVTPQVVGGAGPRTILLLGPRPPGLTFRGSDGTLSGIPLLSGVWAGLRLLVQDLSGSVTLTDLSITIAPTLGSATDGALDFTAPANSGLLAGL